MDDLGTRLLAALGLPDGAPLLLDSSALIVLLEGGGEGRRTMETLIELGREGRLRLLASVAAMVELLRNPATPELALAYRRLLADSRNLELLVVDARAAELAASLLAALDRRRPGKAEAAARGARFADALHLAGALSTGCRAVLTGDEGWAELAPSELRVILLDELAAEFSMLE